MKKLNLDEAKIARGRELAGQIVDQIQTYINDHSTVTVERAILRLLGIDGVDRAEVPLVNGVVNYLQKAGVLGKGVVYWLVNAMLHLQQSPQQIAEAVVDGQLALEQLPQKTDAKI